MPSPNISEFAQQGEISDGTDKCHPSIPCFFKLDLIIPELFPANSIPSWLTMKLKKSTMHTSAVRTHMMRIISGFIRHKLESKTYPNRSTKMDFTIISSKASAN